MTHLVLGLGQIGSAIREILNCDGSDSFKGVAAVGSVYDVLHICFPYSENLVSSVKEYRTSYNPKLVIVHSTVPMGTCEELGAVHSPIRGIHPNLKEGILTFTKYFGGKGAQEAAEIFKALGVTTVTIESSRTTEAMKLWDTTQYGWNIMLEKMIWDFCQKNNVDFNIVYTEANKTYNEGYTRLGRPEFCRYVLKHKDGPIGGHCVIPNLDFLDDEISKYIKDFNKKINN